SSSSAKRKGCAFPCSGSLLPCPSSGPAVRGRYTEISAPAVELLRPRSLDKAGDRSFAMVSRLPAGDSDGAARTIHSDETMAAKKNALRKALKGEPVRQVAAIPFRILQDGSMEVMLVTSRETQRFVVPKGWPMKGKSSRKTAAIEAEQEAGV